MTLRFTPEKLMQRLPHDQILRHCFDSWRAGHCTFEQMIIGALLSLSEENERLTNALVEAAAMQPPPVFIVNNKLVDIEKIKKAEEE